MNKDVPIDLLQVCREHLNVQAVHGSISAAECVRDIDLILSSNDDADDGERFRYIAKRMRGTNPQMDGTSMWMICGLRLSRARTLREAIDKAKVAEVLSTQPEEE